MRNGAFASCRHSRESGTAKAWMPERTSRSDGPKGMPQDAACNPATLLFVPAAKSESHWIPAYAGMTAKSKDAGFDKGRPA